MTKKKWGFWCWSATEWGLQEYENNLDGGPYRTFNAAKKALKKALNEQARKFRNGAKMVDELKESDV